MTIDDAIVFIAHKQTKITQKITTATDVDWVMCN
jgi:hypothetical protein